MYSTKIDRLFNYSKKKFILPLFIIIIGIICLILPILIGYEITPDYDIKAVRNNNTLSEGKYVNVTITSIKPLFDSYDTLDLYIVEDEFKHKYIAQLDSDIAKELINNKTNTFTAILKKHTNDMYDNIRYNYLINEYYELQDSKGNWYQVEIKDYQLTNKEIDKEFTSYYLISHTNNNMILIIDLIIIGSILISIGLIIYLFIYNKYSKLNTINNTYDIHDIKNDISSDSCIYLPLFNIYIGDKYIVKVNYIIYEMNDKSKDIKTYSNLEIVDVYKIDSINKLIINKYTKGKGSIYCIKVNTNKESIIYKSNNGFYISLLEKELIDKLDNAQVIRNYD